MKKFNQMNQLEKLNLIAYGRLLEAVNLTEDQKARLLKLSRFCTENDLCVTEIPHHANWNDNIQQKLFKMGPDWFEYYYRGFYFTNSEGQVVNPTEIYYQVNSKEKRYREGLRKGLNHSDAKLYAYEKLAPGYEQTKQETR